MMILYLFQETEIKQLPRSSLSLWHGSIKSNVTEGGFFHFLI